MNKTDFITLVNAKLPTGSGNILASDHRDTMHTDPSSVAELVYSATLIETQALPSIFSVVTAGITYDINISKVGRRVHLTGKITNGSAGSVAALLNIDDDDYKPTVDRVYTGNGYINNTEPCRIKVNNVSLFSQSQLTSAFLLPGDDLNINISYDTEL